MIPLTDELKNEIINQMTQPAPELPAALVQKTADIHPPKTGISVHFF